MKRDDVIELIGLLLAVAGFVALMYGLSVLAEWLAYVFGGSLALLCGAALIVRANAQSGGDA